MKKNLGPYKKQIEEMGKLCIPSLLLGRSSKGSEVEGAMKLREQALSVWEFYFPEKIEELVSFYSGRMPDEEGNVDSLEGLQKFLESFPFPVCINGKTPVYSAFFKQIRQSSDFWRDDLLAKKLYESAESLVAVGRIEIASISRKGYEYSNFNNQGSTKLEFEKLQEVLNDFIARGRAALKAVGEAKFTKEERLAQ